MAVNTEVIKLYAKSIGTWASNLAFKKTFFNYPRVKQPRSRILSEEEGLRREYARLEYCTPLVDDKLIVLPKPHGPLIIHGQLTILVWTLSVE